jgi:hypothetical protein
MQITSSTQIANAALLHIGEHPIQSIDGTDDKSTTCRTALEIAINQIQTESEWQENWREVALDQEAVDGEDFYTYVLPGDYSLMDYVVTDAGVAVDPLNLRVDIRNNRIFVSSRAAYVMQGKQVRLGYFAIDRDVTSWSPQMVLAVSWRLASLIVMSLTQDPQRKGMIEQLASMKVAEAVASSLSSGMRTNYLSEPSTLSARRVRSSYG